MNEDLEGPSEHERETNKGYFSCQEVKLLVDRKRVARCECSHERKRHESITAGVGK